MPLSKRPRGVPPVFDFSKSQNVKSVAVLYPAPSRFPDGAGGNSIGYKGLVVLPLHVVPQDAGKPVTLNLKLDYAVCEKLCVPAGVIHARKPGRGRRVFQQSREHRQPAPTGSSPE